MDLNASYVISGITPIYTSLISNVDMVLQDTNISQLYATPYTSSFSVNGQNLNCSLFKKDFQLKMSFLNAHGAYTSVYFHLFNSKVYIKTHFLKVKIPFSSLKSARLPRISNMGKICKNLGGA